MRLITLKFDLALNHLEISLAWFTTNMVVIGIRNAIVTKSCPIVTYLMKTYIMVCHVGQLLYLLPYPFIMIIICDIQEFVHSDYFYATYLTFNHVTNIFTFFHLLPKLYPRKGIKKMRYNYSTLSGKNYHFPVFVRNKIQRSPSMSTSEYKFKWAFQDLSNAMYWWLYQVLNYISFP